MQPQLIFRGVIQDLRESPFVEDLWKSHPWHDCSYLYLVNSGGGPRDHVAPEIIEVGEYLVAKSRMLDEIHTGFKRWAGEYSNWIVTVERFHCPIVERPVIRVKFDGEMVGGKSGVWTNYTSWLE
jgi:hypothetical protein